MCHSSACAAEKDLQAEEESEQRAGRARARERWREQEKPRQPLHGWGFVTPLKSVVSKGCYIGEGGITTVMLIQCFHSVLVVLGEYMRLSLFCPHVTPAFSGYLLKKEVNWMKSQHVFLPLGRWIMCRLKCNVQARRCCEGACVCACVLICVSVYVCFNS